MKKTSPKIGPRRDFPVWRLFQKLILGNMVFLGGVFLLGLGLEILEEFFKFGYESLSEFAEETANHSEEFVSGLIESPEMTALLFVGGTFGGLVWYWIARHLETRRLKKRFGLLTKSCTSPKPDVKSPQS